MKIQRTSIIGSLAAVAVILLAGCGGAGTPGNPASQSRGAIQAQVTFDGTTRAQPGSPLGARSIKIRIVAEGSTTDLAQPQIIAAPGPNQTSSFEFQQIPVGSITLIVTVHPDLNATGPVMATGQANGVVVANQVTTINVRAALTLTGILVNPAGPITLTLGGTATQVLTATLQDAQADTLIGFPVAWSSGNTIVATAVQDSTNPYQCLVTAKAVGSTTVEIREFNTGIKTDVQVNVVAAGP